MDHTRHHRPNRRSYWLGAACLAGALALLLAAAPGSMAMTADEAATNSYLQARYELYQAFVRDEAASRSGRVSASERLRHECPGVLAGPFSGSDIAQPREAPRERGEAERRGEQLFTLEAEITQTLDVASGLPNRAAIEAFAGQVASLSWSNPVIAQAVQFEASELEEPLAAPPLNTCADIRTWVQSGHRLLSAETREFKQAQARHYTALAEHDRSPSVLLKPYENAAARPLLARTSKLEEDLLAFEISVFYLSLRTEHALGKPETVLEESEFEPVLGRGRTAAGTRFTVRRGVPELGPAKCRHLVAVEFTTPKPRYPATTVQEETVCPSQPSKEPALTCKEGLEKIVLTTQQSARTAELRLLDGQRITSRVIAITRKYGGPGGVYVQEVRRSSGSPVSLTELDSAGRVVKVVRLSGMRCRREPSPTYSLSTFSTYTPITHVTVPENEPLVITGIQNPVGGRPVIEVGITGDQSNSRSEQKAAVYDYEESTELKAFPWSLATHCAPQPYAVIFGVLSPPAASLLARTPEGLVALTAVPITPELKPPGPLLYGVFKTPPSELIVRRSDGSTLYTESLAKENTEETGYCEGYAET
jgi:hypothetical protein